VIVALSWLRATGAKTRSNAVSASQAGAGCRAGSVLWRLLAEISLDRNFIGSPPRKRLLPSLGTGALRSFSCEPGFHDALSAKKLKINVAGAAERFLPKGSLTGFDCF
jgi:hypothetical protein